MKNDTGLYAADGRKIVREEKNEVPDIEELVKNAIEQEHKAADKVKRILSKEKLDKKDIQSLFLQFNTLQASSKVLSGLYMAQVEDLKRTINYMQMMNYTDSLKILALKEILEEKDIFTKDEINSKLRKLSEEHEAAARAEIKKKTEKGTSVEPASSLEEEPLV